MTDSNGETVDVRKLIADLCQLKTSQRISIGRFVGARLGRYGTELGHVKQMVEIAQKQNVLCVIANMAKQFTDENARDGA
jgi:hypothetical protein